MTKVFAVAMPALVAVLLLRRWRRQRNVRPLVLSPAWLAAQVRADDCAGAPWVGVSWKRPYDKWLDANGRYNRWLEHARDASLDKESTASSAVTSPPAAIGGRRRHLPAASPRLRRS